MFFVSLDVFRFLWGYLWKPTVLCPVSLHTFSFFRFWPWPFFFNSEILILFILLTVNGSNLESFQLPLYYRILGLQPSLAFFKWHWQNNVQWWRRRWRSWVNEVVLDVRNLLWQKKKLHNLSHVSGSFVFLLRS